MSVMRPSSYHANECSCRIRSWCFRPCTRPILFEGVDEPVDAFVPVGAVKLLFETTEESLNSGVGDDAAGPPMESHKSLSIAFADADLTGSPVVFAPVRVSDRRLAILKDGAYPFWAWCWPVWRLDCRLCSSDQRAVKAADNQAAVNLACADAELVTPVTHRRPPGSNSSIQRTSTSLRECSNSLITDAVLQSYCLYNLTVCSLCPSNTSPLTDSFLA